MRLHLAVPVSAVLRPVKLHFPALSFSFLRPCFLSVVFPVIFFDYSVGTTMARPARFVGLGPDSFKVRGPLVKFAIPPLWKISTSWSRRIVLGALPISFILM